jgi:MoxR-like ATPase
MPGLGKTTLAKAIADTIGGTFARIQCTPDLLPSDITGFSIFDPESRSFSFQPGPVFSDIVLVDEINRATPRTQSALLEAMAEGQVTVDNVRRNLSPIFFVIATQNPIDHHGTFALPEAQLDRFAMKLSIGYPDRQNEVLMLREHSSTKLPRHQLQVSVSDLIQLRSQTESVIVTPAMCEYIVDLCRATRTEEHIRLGVSPRGMLTWKAAAQAHAVLDGRKFVTPDDVQAVMFDVFNVRLQGTYANLHDVVARLQHDISVPMENP